MPTYAVTIGGAAKSIQPGWRIAESANGRSTFSFQVLSLDGAYRAAIDDAVVFTEDGTTIFGGLIDRPLEAGFGGVSSTAAIVQNVSAVDFNIYASRIPLTADIPAGTFKAFLTVVAAALSAQGVTLDAGQATGPSLPALSYTDRPINEVLDEGCSLASGSGSSSWIWNISYTKVLSGVEAGTAAAPFNITDGDGNVLGDITVEQARSGDYANYVILYGGEGQQEILFEPHNGNGSARRFALNVPVVSLVGALRIDGGGGGYPVGTYGTDDMPWTFDYATNEIVQRVDQTVIAVGHYIEMSYVGQFPVRVVSDGGASAANRVVKTYTEPAVFDVAVMQALADSYVARDMSAPKTVRYSAAWDKVGLHPGQTQTIASTKRACSGSHLFTDVQILHVGGSVVQRQVTAVSSERLPATTRETFRRVFGGGGASASSASAITIVTGGTYLSSPAFLGGSDRTFVALNPAAWVRVPNALPFVAPATLSVRLRAMGAVRTAGIGVTVRLYDDTAAAAAITAAKLTPGAALTAEEIADTTGTVTATHKYFLEMCADTAGEGVTALGHLESL